MKLKICGMKYHDNILKVAALKPNYLGFIFYDKSPRFVTEPLPEISKNIKKVGVFVNSTIETIITIINNYDLQAVQLHGQETPEFCQKLQKKQIEIIKVFSIKDQFDFNQLSAFENLVDYFLFDTKGPNPGGNGYCFDWSILNQYNSKTPYFLSGGIGLDDIKSIQNFKNSPAAQHCFAIDVNSKFELKPAYKDDVKLKQLMQQL
jgi:phosphoribosylanthranilate isomerase